jgi:hypothetical protein
MGADIHEYPAELLLFYVAISFSASVIYAQTVPPPTATLTDLENRLLFPIIRDTRNCAPNESVALYR